MSRQTDLTGELGGYVDGLIESHGVSVAREVVLSHPAFFAAYIFGYRLKDFHVKTLEEAHKNQHLIVLLPEAHGKSSLVAGVLPLYELARNPNLRIVVMGKTDEVAAEYADFLMQFLDPKSGNERFLRLFGNWVDKRRWTKAAMDIAPRQVYDRFPSLRFVGAKPTVVGTGCDILFADDLIDWENAKTPGARQALAGWWNVTAQSMPRSMFDRDLKTGWLKVPRGITWPRDENGRPEEYERIVILCTLYHVEDFVSVKVGSTDDLPVGEVVPCPNDPLFNVLYYDCWRDPAEKEPLWPEHRSRTWLETQRESRGYLDFNKRLRNKPIDEASTAIKQAYIKGGLHEGVTYKGCLCADVSVGEYDPRSLLVLGVDPGSGRKGKRSNWTAMVLLASDADHDSSQSLPPARVVDVWRGQVGYDDIIAKMFDGSPQVGAGFHKAYSYDFVAIEVNDKQVWLLQNAVVKRKMAEYPGLVREWETTGRNSKLDADVGVRAIDVAFKDSLIEIPWKEPSDQEHMLKLVEELCKFPEGSTDLVVAFWIAYMTIQSITRSSSAFYSDEFEEGPYMVNPLYQTEVKPKVKSASTRPTRIRKPLAPIIVAANGQIKEA